MLEQSQDVCCCLLLLLCGCCLRRVLRAQRVNTDSDDGLKGAVEVLITEVFGETERSLSQVRRLQPAAVEVHCRRCAVLTLLQACQL